jgi:biotin synthase
LTRGANIVMPILTPLKFRADYQLYDDKPCVEDTKEHCRSCITMRIHSVGKDVAWGEWGDPQSDGQAERPPLKPE